MENRVQVTFDQQASEYDTKYERPKNILHFEKIRRMELLVEQAQKLQPKSTLDAGCGSGLALSALYKRWPDAQLAGVDLSYLMLQQAQRNTEYQAFFMQSLVEQLPFGDNSFDLIYALGVLDYLKDPSLFFKTVQRIANPGGYFIFTYPNGHSINRAIRTTLRTCTFRTGENASAVPIKEAAIQRFASDYGFELLDQHFITYGNGLVALPWSVSMSQQMEKWCARRRLGRYLAWSSLCVARKKG